VAAAPGTSGTATAATATTSARRPRTGWRVGSTTQVCHRHTVPLARAQAELATDWCATWLAVGRPSGNARAPCWTRPRALPGETTRCWTAAKGLPRAPSARDHRGVIERHRRGLPSSTGAPCDWCGRRRGAALPLRSATPSAPVPTARRHRTGSVTSAPACWRSPLRPPHRRPARPGRCPRRRPPAHRGGPAGPPSARRRCRWCSRPARVGWCATCAQLPDAAAGHTRCWPRWRPPPSTPPARSSRTAVRLERPS
jgi:hypothetical protein